jgi:Flp pilus assembly protein TadD
MRAYYSLAGLYLKEGKAEKALEQFNTLLAVDPKQVGPHMLIGVIYDSLGKFDLSEKHYRAALEIDPQFAPAANNLAYILAEGDRDLNDALKFAQIAKAKLPEDPSVMDTLGWVYYRRGIYDLSIAEFRGSLAKAPDNPTVAYHLGLAYAKKGETDNARAELRRAIALNPEFPEAAAAEKMLAELK